MSGNNHVKILVIDDDLDIVSVITFLLEDAGYITKGIYNGEQVLAEIAEFAPDLVIMDVMLGNMDGRAICKEIKMTLDEPPVILISAGHDLRGTLGQQGAPDDFIPKPFDIDELLGKVKLYTSES